MDWSVYATEMTRKSVLGRFTLEAVSALEVHLIHTWSVNGKNCYSQVHLSSPWLPWNLVDFREAEVHFKCSWNHTWARTSTALSQSDNNQFNRVCFTKIEGHDFIFFLSFQWLMLPFSQQLRLSQCQFWRWFRRSHFDVSICKTDRKDLEISHRLCEASLVL